MSARDFKGLPPPDREALTFISLNGTFTQRRILPSEFPVIVGRLQGEADEGKGMKFASKVVSRMHAEMIMRDNKFYIRDTKSSGGTFVNYKRLSAASEESPWTELKDGDVIALGSDISLDEVLHKSIRMVVQLPLSHRASFVQPDDDSNGDTTIIMPYRRTTFNSRVTITSPEQLKKPKDSPEDAYAASIGDMDSLLGQMLGGEYNTRLTLYTREDDQRTLECSTSTTTTEILEKFGQIGWRLYLIRNRLHERELRPKERPGAIQLLFLLQCGFTFESGILEEASNDHTYLFQFICSPPPDAQPEQFKTSIVNNTWDLSWKNLSSLDPFLADLASKVVCRLDLSGNPSIPEIIPSQLSIESLSFLTELILTDLIMTKVPHAVRFLQNLRVLDMSRNSLQALPPDLFEGLSQLRMLHLSGNRLKFLGESIGNLLCLESFYVDNNELVALPESIGQLVNLSWLDVSHNVITSLPPGLFTISELQTFLASGNAISSLPPTFNRAASLTFVDLRRNKLTELRDCAGLTSLQTLLVDDNALRFAEIGAPVLLTVSASHNPLAAFFFQVATPPQVPLATPPPPPPLIAGMTPPPSPSPIDLNRTISFESAGDRLVLGIARANSSNFPPLRGFMLTSLNLSHCGLSALPPLLPATLRHIYVSHNVLASLPGSITSCSLLETLVVDNNQLTTLPSLAGCSSLSTLDCCNNKLRTLPSDIWCVPLISILAASNEIETLPPPPPSLSIRTAPLAATLQALSLGQNRLSSNANFFTLILSLGMLRLLDLSYNNLTDMPQHIGQLQNLTELYLSGNKLTALPEDLEKLRYLSVLTLAGNQLKSLPGGIAKLKWLRFLDASYNLLNYDVTNWPEHWNWVWNLELIHLDLSGNENMALVSASRENTDFAKLEKLKILDLKDVKIQVPIPASLKRDGRFRRMAHATGILEHGLSETLGSGSHLLLWNLSIKLHKESDSLLFAIMDGTDAALPRFINEKLPTFFMAELSRGATIDIAFARTFLQLNAEVGKWGAPLSTALCSVVVCFVSGNMLFVANVGSAKAMLCRNGRAVSLSVHHSCSLATEAARIRQAGGCLERDGSLSRPKGVDPTDSLATTLQPTAILERDDVSTTTSTVVSTLPLSRCMGMNYLMPLVNSLPYVKQIDISSQDEYLVLANGAFWDYLDEDAVATALSNMGKMDCNRRALKLRDIAVSHGAREALMVQVIDVRPTKQVRVAAPLMRSSSQMLSGKEIAPPTEGAVLVFTDIKSSTSLWEKDPHAMHDSIGIHNSIMREYLWQVGGYEVKTEGDAFMVAFWAVKEAVDWCVTVQKILLEANWPASILREPAGAEKRGENGEILFRGLSVRMGIHSGFPVCENDPTTGRMDYFGPVVNRAARVCGAADGGEIFISADSWEELRSSEKDMADLKRKGVEVIVRDLGEYNLKGLEAPEHLFVMFPKSLGGRAKFTRTGQQTDNKNLSTHIKNLNLPSSETALEGWRCVRIIRENNDEAKKGRLLLTPLYVCFEPKWRSFLLKNREKESVAIKLKYLAEIKIVTLPSFGPCIEIQTTSNEVLLLTNFQGADLNEIANIVLFQKKALKQKDINGTAIL